MHARGVMVMCRLGSNRDGRTVGAVSEGEAGWGCWCRCRNGFFFGSLSTAESSVKVP